jgi:hypothetical protein
LLRIGGISKKSAHLFHFATKAKTVISITLQLFRMNFLAKLKAHIFSEIVLAALILMVPAIINGSPFYDFDSGDYIDSGIRLSASLSRPMFYSLFILVTSLGFSLWLTVFCQSMLLAWSLKQLLISLRLNRQKTLIILTLALTVFTPIGRLSGQIMSDVFTTILLILGSAWLIGGPKWLNQNKFLLPLIAFSLSTHLGHFFLLLVFIPFMAYRHGKSGIVENWKTFLRLGLYLCAIILGSLAINHGKVKRLTLSPAAEAFQISKLAHTGALQEYLKENCQQSSNFYCAYKDSIPNDFNTFLWSQKSPMVKAGGIRNGWQINKSTIAQVKASDAAMKVHYKGVQNDFIQQCKSNSWLVGWFVDSENTGKVLQRHFPMHLSWAKNARFDKLQLHVVLDPIFRGALIASLLYMLFALIKPSFPQERLWLLALFALVFINHLSVAFLSIPDNRLAARVTVVLVIPILVRRRRMNPTHH